jgi:hypothetical protein
MRLLMAQASSMLRVWISAPRPFQAGADDGGAACPAAGGSIASCTASM